MKIAEVKTDLVARVTDEVRGTGALPSAREAEDLVAPIIQKVLHKIEEPRRKPDVPEKPKAGDVVRRESFDVAFDTKAGRVAPRGQHPGKFRASWITENLPPRLWAEFLKGFPLHQRTQLAFQLWIHCLREHAEWRPRLEALASNSLRGKPHYETALELVKKSKVALAETWLGKRIGPFVRV